MVLISFELKKLLIVFLRCAFDLQRPII